MEKNGVEAQLDWSLKVECPSCQHTIDLSNCEDGQFYSKHIFTDQWESLENIEETCPKCKNDFKISGVVY